MKASGVITLLTDFGLRDGYVAAMKGVILRICPAATVIDLSHDIAPQDIRAGAFILSAHYSYFPEGTVHVAVIDPGVGSEREVILAYSGNYFFLAPNNGLLSFVVSIPGVRFYQANNPAYWLPEVSNTFHGRDIFAPLAAHLANGEKLENLFAPISGIVQMPSLLPLVQDDKIMGQVVYVDRFGNLITNIAKAHLPEDYSRTRVKIGKIDIGPVVPFYAAGQVGKPLATVGSFDRLEIAIRGGSAAEFFPEYRDLRIEVSFEASGA